LLNVKLVVHIVTTGL